MRPIPIAVLLAVLFTASVAAELVPTDTRFGPLRIQLHQVDTTIDNQVAITKVVQVFANDNNAQLEAIYVFPTPAEATIVDFSMTIDGKVMHGELLERNQARQVYEKIVARAKDPGLLEQVGKNVFRMRVFPIAPHSQQRIELTYVERVTYENGRCTWRYPVRVPGVAAETRADALTITANLRSQIPIGVVDSATHPFHYTRGAAGEVTCTFAAERAALEKDVELAYTLTRAASGFDVVANRVDGDGTFLLLVTPSPDAQEGAMPKDMTFVFDTSGSMDGEKMKQAKAALRFCVGKLKPGDRFNIVRFSDTVDTFRPDHVEATEENRQAAGVFVDRLEALGSTNISGALLRALEHKPAPGRPHMIVFLTDGLATTGECDPKAILRQVLAVDGEATRIFTFGVGNDVNRGLLEDLAESTRAISCAVAPGQDLEAPVAALQRRIVAPVIAGLELDWGGADVHSVYPKRIPDLYAGVQLMITGRYGKPGTHRVTLHGTCAGKPLEIAAEVTLPEKREESAAVKYVWGARKIADLLDTIRRNGENREIIGDVVRLSREYRVATPYTSFLVLESEAAYDREGLPRGADPDRLASNLERPRDVVERKGVFNPQARESDHNESADNEDYHQTKGQSADFLGYVPGEGGGERGRAPGQTDAMGIGGGGGGGGGAYGGRLGGHENLVARGGGSRATESAVSVALRWLARHQNVDGCWSAKEFPTRCAGQPCTGAGDPATDVGVTGASLLTFLGAGYTHLSRDTQIDPMTPTQELRFGNVVKQAVRWLIQQQDAEGCAGDRASEWCVYNHALATLALSEAYGMTQSPILKGPAQKAIDFLVSAQTPGMAWGRTPKSAAADAETSMWCVMALKSAEISGLNVPESASDGARAWVQGLEAKDPLNAAIGMICRMFLDHDRKDATLHPSAQLLLQGLPGGAGAGKGLGTLCRYAATVALFQYDGPDSGGTGKYWKAWNQALIREVLQGQAAKAAGCSNGSWDANTTDAFPGGRIFATALDELTLEVYYRYASAFAGHRAR